MKIKWTSKKLLVNEIFENPSNPRKISMQSGNQLKRSLEKFGLCEPIVVNVDGQIIGGHQRFRLMQQMGQYEIDCFIPDRELTEEEVQELTIRLNKNSGDWDYDILADQWDVPSLLDWGFTEKELSLVVNDGETAESRPAMTIDGDRYVVEFSTDTLTPAQCDTILDQVLKLSERFKSKLQVEKNGVKIEWQKKIS